MGVDYAHKLQFLIRGRGVINVQKKKKKPTTRLKIYY